MLGNSFQTTNHLLIKKMKEIEVNKKSLTQKDPGQAADSFVLQAMAAVGYPKYSCTWDARSREFSNEFDGINLDDDLINTICPNGIRCADDIEEFGWMFALHDNPLL